MKPINLKIVALAVLTTLFLSCSGGRYANTGTSSDRTGTNGATNGTGKPPKGTAHEMKY